MAGSDSAFDGPLAAATVQGTDAPNGVVLARVRVSQNEDGSEAEGSTQEPVFGAMGVGGNPLEPDDDGAAEAVCARSSDGLPVLAMRDLRIEQARAAAPPKGTVYIAGYHGAELRFDVSGAASTATLRDSAGSGLHIEAHRVVIGEDGGGNGVALIQGVAGTAQDVLLAQPAVDLLGVLGQIVVLLAGAVNGLAPGTIPPPQLTQLTTALAPFLVGGSPSAPTTRAPKLLAQPGP